MTPDRRARAFSIPAGRSDGWEVPVVGWGTRRTNTLLMKIWGFGVSQDGTEPQLHPMVPV